MSGPSQLAARVVDFSAYGRLDHPRDELTDGQLRRLGEDIVTALRADGFVYLRNHGLQDERIQTLWNVSNAFYQLPETTKSSYATDAMRNKWDGYSPIGVEGPNRDRPGDCHECYNYFGFLENRDVPDKHIPGFSEANEGYFNEGLELAVRVLECISLGLHHPTRHYLRPWFKKLEEGRENMTQTKTVLCPALDVDTENTIRFGEHGDFTVLTFDFVDETGGLQFEWNGEWVDATPVPGAVVVFAGEYLKRWTSNQIKATRHRVVAFDAAMRRRERRSTLFFLVPDNGTSIAPLDGSDKYPPLQPEVYINERFKEFYSK